MGDRSKIDRAFDAAGVTTSAVAEYLGVTRACVLWWRYGRNRVSPTSAKAINARFGIPLHVLRPDIWEPPRRPRKAA